jgi:hypothetical protein
MISFALNSTLVTYQISQRKRLHHNIYFGIVDKGFFFFFDGPIKDVNQNIKNIEL